MDKYNITADFLDIQHSLSVNKLLSSVSIVHLCFAINKIRIG